MSPSIALTLSREGFDVVTFGIAACSKPRTRMFARAFGEDRIVVRSNCEDFAKLARMDTVLVGLVFFEDGGLLRDEQLRLVREALGHLADEIAAGARPGQSRASNLVGLMYVFEPLP